MRELSGKPWVVNMIRKTEIQECWTIALKKDGISQHLTPDRIAEMLTEGGLVASNGAIYGFGGIELALYSVQPFTEATVFKVGEYDSPRVSLRTFVQRTETPSVAKS